jgi:hypothetical protein
MHPDADFLEFGHRFPLLRKVIRINRAATPNSMHLSEDRNSNRPEGRPERIRDGLQARIPLV